MESFDVDEILNTMVILVDSREQDTARARERYSRFGAPYRRAHLSYGDYCCNYRRDGAWRYDEEETVHPDVVIERKMNLDELAMCFSRERKRFTAEFERIKAAGAKPYLLIENATWENLLAGKYKSKFNPKAFKASLSAWMARYNCTVITCKSETSGELIKEILYRELKERLQNE